MSALAVLTPTEVSAMLAGRRVARAIRVAQLAEDVRVIAELELIASLDVPPLPRRTPTALPLWGHDAIGHGWPPPVDDVAHLTNLTALLRTRPRRVPS